MTTASLLMTVTTTWNITNEKRDKEEICMGQNIKAITAEAAKELRESSATREQALAIMKQWIQQNSDIENVRQDESFILRFLRHKKYSIPMAQQTLLKYLSLRSYYPDIFKDLDYNNSNLKEIFNSGYIMISPIRDSKGRRVIVYNINKFDPRKFNCWDMCRVHAIVYESLMNDPVDQMCGYIHVCNGQGLSTAHVTTWNPTDFARLFKWGEQSIPMRHREFHFVNIPSALKYVVDFAVSKVTPKMAARVKIHTNQNQLQQHTDPACLPTTYGGTLEVDDMINYTLQVLHEHRQNVLDLVNMKILSTRGIISSRRNKTETVNGDETIQGSFRKLEID